LGGERERSARHLEHREVDDHLRTGVDQLVQGAGDAQVAVDLGHGPQVEPGVLGVDGGHQLEVVVGDDGLADGPAHAPGRPDDAHPGPTGHAGGGGIDPGGGGGGGGGGGASSSAGGGG